MDILIVDDEKEIADLIAVYLRNEGFCVFTYYSSKQALEALDHLQIDLAILDVMMPDIDGFALCSLMREKYTFPIIFVTAKGEDIDKISGLTLGGDDYVTKPFQPLELVARVKAQLRRYKKYNSADTPSNVIDFRDIVINFDTHECYLKDHLLELTPLEFSILWCLCRNRGNVVKMNDLFMEVWQEKYFEKDNNTIMVHIRHLREKMGDCKRKPRYIQTVWGVGYKIDK